MKRKDERSWPYTPTQWFHRSVANSCFQGCINSDVHLESTRYSIIVKIHNLHAYFHTPTWTSSLLFCGPHATNVEIQPRYGEYAWCCSAWDIAQKPLHAPNTTSALRDWQRSHSQSPKAVAASSRGSSVENYIVNHIEVIWFGSSKHMEIILKTIRTFWKLVRNEVISKLNGPLNRIHLSVAFHRPEFMHDKKTEHGRSFEIHAQSNYW